MIRLLQLIWHGCWHEWKPTCHIIDHYDISFGPRSFMYRAHTTRCEKCGRISAWKDRYAGIASSEDRQ